MSKKAIDPITLLLVGTDLQKQRQRMVRGSHNKNVYVLFTVFINGRMGYSKLENQSSFIPQNSNIIKLEPNHLDFQETRTKKKKN